MNIASHKQEIVPLRSLKEATYNPRDISPEALASLKAGIKEFGLVQPIVARKEDGLIIGGHQRVAAYRELLAEQKLSAAEIGAAPVPVIFLAGMSDAKTKMLNLALNKISGDWNYDKLSTLFEELSGGTSGMDPALVQLSGFSLDEVGDMMGLLKGATPLATTSEELDQQVAEGLATQARRFSFTVGSDNDAKLCNEALKMFGMTGPSDAPAAFLAAMKASVERKMFTPEVAKAVEDKKRESKRADHHEKA